MTARAPKIILGLSLAGAAAVVTAIVAIIVLRFVVFDFYRVPQGGMHPTIPEDSLVLTWRRPYSSIDEVRRGDVVVYRVQENAQRYDFIWRVVALPGDEVEVVGTTVRVQDVELPREHVRFEGDLEISRETSEGVTYEVAYPREGSAPEPISLVVPEGHIFVLGDNRWRSSRRHTGAVPFDAVVGRTVSQM